MRRNGVSNSQINALEQSVKYAVRVGRSACDSLSLLFQNAGYPIIATVTAYDGNVTYIIDPDLNVCTGEFYSAEHAMIWCDEHAEEIANARMGKKDIPKGCKPIVIDDKVLY